MSGSSLSMPVVWTDRHRLHEPKGELWLGVWIEGTEVPARGDRIREALMRPALVRRPRDYDDALFEAVHDRLSLVSGQRIRRMGGRRVPERAGAGRVVPYVFPLPQLTSGRAPRRPAAASARTGMFAMDTMTLIGPGTWEAARAVAEAALPQPTSSPTRICRVRHLPATRTPRRAATSTEGRAT